MRGYLYILECSDGSFYTGSTNNIELRFAEHQAGLGSDYTKKRLPVKLVFLEEFQRVDDAYRRERQVHGWSRKKKIALIQGEYNKLPELSRNRMDPCRISSPVPELVEGPAKGRGRAGAGRYSPGPSTSSGTGRISVLMDRIKSWVIGPSNLSPGEDIMKKEGCCPVVATTIMKKLTVWLYDTGEKEKFYAKSIKLSCK